MPCSRTSSARCRFANARETWSVPTSRAKTLSVFTRAELGSTGPARGEVVDQRRTSLCLSASPRAAPIHQSTNWCTPSQIDKGGTFPGRASGVPDRAPRRNRREGASAMRPWPSSASLPARGRCPARSACGCRDARGTGSLAPIRHRATRWGDATRMTASRLTLSPFSPEARRARLPAAL